MEMVRARPGGLYREGNTGLKESWRVLPGRSALIQLRLTTPFVKAVHGAAQRRDMAVTNWVRRVMAVALAAEGFDPHALLDEVPAPVKFGTHGGYRANGSDGEADLRTWCPHPGCDGAHLSSAK